jgi:predicted esterase
MPLLGDCLRQLPPTHAVLKTLSGRTPFFASTYDQRFSFGLYVPKSHTFTGPPLTLLIVVHGNGRQTGGYLKQLQKFCDNNSVILMTPLFPAGIIDPNDWGNYKEILYRPRAELESKEVIRFDEVLWNMVEQAAESWRIKTDKVYLHGFSAGGQFAHRMLYLHPERFLGVSIGAPGRITSPSSDYAWPGGLKDVEQVFGLKGAPDFEQIRKVSVQFIVGEKDLDTGLLDLAEPNDAEKEAGKTRPERIKWLKKALEEKGVTSELVETPGLGHEGLKMIPTLEEWLARQLSN